MRTVETPGGIPIFLSKQEHSVYESIKDKTYKGELSEQDAYVCQQLVNKGALSRIIENGKTYYTRRKGSL